MSAYGCEPVSTLIRSGQRLDKCDDRLASGRACGEILPRSRLQRRGPVTSAVTVAPAANAETTAAMAVAILIRDAFCASVSRHQVNPIPRARVADTSAVTVPATAAG